VRACVGLARARGALDEKVAKRQIRRATQVKPACLRTE
jgi:hypothetical protein